jgi:signal transduction histidine kinase
VFVNELLHVYRLQDGDAALTMAPVDLSALCAEVVGAWAELAKVKGVDLRIEGHGGPVQVHCDEAKIRQVVSNLVSNALKFTEKGSVTVTVAAEADQVTVSVTDTGVGILPKDLSRIFDRFFQGSATVVSKGTGIGLAIAKTWVEAHDGQIFVESKPGHGARFWFHLPRQ